MSKSIWSIFLLFIILLITVISGCTPVSAPVSPTLTPLPAGTLIPTTTAEGDIPSAPESVENINTDIVSCASPLVRLQTGQGAECNGGNIHAWPVGMESDNCHGWVAYDNKGRLHENSANNITCNSDGTFSFTQYAGSITCEGGSGGVTKTYTLNSCEQDIPPTLYTKAIDLTCCTQPDSPECQVGVPSVSVQASSAIIYLNGQECSEK